MGRAEFELTEDRSQMISAGLIAPPVVGVSPAGLTVGRALTMMVSAGLIARPVRGLDQQTLPSHLSLARDCMCWYVR